MTSSAQALNQFFAAISQQGNNDEPFLVVAARVLRLNGEDAELQALARVHKLLKRVKSDISTLPFDDETMRHIKGYMNPFEGLSNLSQVHFNMKNAKANFLQPSNLVGLINLHVAISGHVTFHQASKEFYEIGAEIREYIVEIQTLDLPMHARMAIHTRLEQVASMLENYFFYGGETIKDELEALAGSLAFNKATAGTEGAGFFKKAAGSLKSAMKLLAATDSTLGLAIGIPKKVDELRNFFE
ncbi:hypothetical protein MASR2M74_19460 [Paracoccaceae bacterium]